jgi:chromate transport protein ChrA
MAAGLPGAFAGAIGYLLPVIGLAIVPAAVFVRYRTSRALTVCFQGVAAAGVGALLATVVTFGRASLVDVPAVVIAAVGLGVLVLRLPIPVVLFGSAGVGLLLRVTSWWPG